MKNALLFLLCSLALMSCRKYNVIYQKENTIPNEWSYENPSDFEFSATDSTKLCDVLLKVEHLNNFEYQNIYVKIATTFPTMNIVEDVVSLNISNDQGGWQGKCENNLCETVLVLQEKTKLQQGKYTIKIFQHSRNELLKGVNKLTLEIRQLK